MRLIVCVEDRWGMAFQWPEAEHGRGGQGEDSGVYGRHSSVDESLQ